jgi:DNA-binding PadR family transcriptional regulator
MSATRLLILGALRFMQPAHGYEIRQELLSWQLEPWTAVGTGSIYSALRTLEKDGAIRAVGSGRHGNRPARTSYEMTDAGRREFMTLLRQAWWQVHPSTEPLVPAIGLFTQLSRQELSAALQSRLAQMQAHLEQLTTVRATIRDGAAPPEDEIPEHVRELLDFLSARGRAELEWTRQFLRRLRAGSYRLVDDPAAPADPGAPADPADPAPPADPGAPAEPAARPARPRKST